jgi:hypothetical protein
MTIVCPDVGEVLLLKYMLNHTAATDVKMHLYVSDITPAEDDVVGDYTPNEASDSYYTAATLTGTSWTVATVTGTSSATYAQQVFSFSGTANVYGYYVTDNADTNLLWAERFDAAPFLLPGGGGQVAINPAIELA